MRVKTADFEVVLSVDARAADLDRLSSTESQFASGTGVEGRASGVVAEPASPEVLESPSASARAGSDVALTASAGSDLVVITAPSVGLFYRAPAPGEPPYTNAGEEVAPGATLGLIEAMKVYTAVHASVAGTVVSVLAEDGDFVQFGQPLFEVRASEAGE